MTKEENSGMAIASLVLGIAGFIPLLGFICSILAVVFGFVSLNQIKKEKLSGKGFATAGIILGFVSFAISLLITIVWALISSLMFRGIAA